MTQFVHHDVFNHTFVGTAKARVERQALRLLAAAAPAARHFPQGNVRDAHMSLRMSVWLR